jgi:glycosyltransferase involved in cell wall biosynthesis
MLDEEVEAKSFFVGHSVDILSTVADGLKLNVRETLRSIIKEHDIDIVYMHNVHPALNAFLSRISRRKQVRFVQHIHEPFVEDKSVYGGLQQFWLYLFEHAQERILRNTDIAIVSSDEGMRLFDKRYPFFKGRKMQIPLMYEDLAESNGFDPERTFVTFIGPPSLAKGSDMFIKIVSYAATHAPELEFQVISRKEIRDSRFSELPNLRVYFKDRISDDEFGIQLKKSIVTLAPYITARQSSSVLTSFMYGVPVIGTEIGGLKEVIRNSETGHLISPGATPEEWISAIRDVRNALPRMSLDCRASYEREFSESNWQKYLEELLNG